MPDSSKGEEISGTERIQVEGIVIIELIYLLMIGYLPHPDRP